MLKFYFSKDFSRRKALLLFLIFLCLALFLIFWFSLPEPLFNTPCSTVLEDEHEELLAARIARDGQWRFPQIEKVPVKFKEAVITFEDKNFYSHPGIDLTALGSAIRENMRAGKIVRGGSTLTMQVIRLARKNPKRTFWEKFKECLLALRLEISSSKDDILRYYASEAPFGGNVVGLEAASWRYFGRSPEKLSWAESATLAVLPNSPSLIFPGKNQQRLLEKRNRLLRKLKDKGGLDNMAYEASLREPVPGPPHPLPVLAPHLLGFCEKKGMGGRRNISTINATLQKRVNKILDLHYEKLSGNGIRNAAALVLEVESGKVLTYCGNVLQEDVTKNFGEDVDIIQAPRSTGSILKPLLYALILDEGKLLSKSLVADIPTLIAGYAPKNFYLTYDGAVSFQASIARSLNVPAVRQLQEYGVEKFHSNLRKLGISTLARPANHYGLSIILGGAEATLWDLSSVYRNLAWYLNHYHQNLNREMTLKYSRPVFLKGKKENTPLSVPLRPASVYLMMEAMNEVSRPDEEAGWKDYASAYKIAWKTGTSYGFRDGWAIGCTPQHVVAVWVGNADGEGRPELTGIGTAAPLMFDIFKMLRSPRWFMQPFNDMRKTVVCSKSGFKAGEYCEQTDTVWIQKQGINSPFCPYHKMIHLDPAGKYRVTSDCESTGAMKNMKWFVLPPAMEYYYKNRNSTYRTLPPFRPDCITSIHQMKSLDIIYPLPDARIYIPVELDGKPGRTVFEVAHRDPSKTIFWYLDNFYMGSTRDFHQMAFNPEAGRHKLTVTDETGESRQLFFEVIDNEKMQ